MTVGIELQRKPNTSSNIKLGRLGDHVEILSGFAFDSSRFASEGEMPLIRIRDVVRGRTETYYSGPFEERFVVRKGDLLVGMDGDFNRETWSSEPALLNQRVCRISPDDAHLDRRYLYHFLPQALMEIWHATPFATVKHLSVKAIREIALPLPPLEEQRRIAAILDKADELRTKRRQALAQLDALAQSIFNTMFGTMQWAVSDVGTCLRSEDFRRRPVKSADRQQRQGPYPYYGASGVIDYVDDFIFDAERLLVAEDGANLLSRNSPIAFIAEGKYWVNNHAHVLAENGSSDLRYVQFTLERLDLARFVTGSAQPKLNAASLRSIPIPLPPLDLQRVFAARVEDVNRLKAQQRVQLAQLDSLFTSLQYRAFKGEL